MKKNILILSVILSIANNLVFAQTQLFPQQLLNQQLNKTKTSVTTIQKGNTPQTSDKSAAFGCIKKMEEVKCLPWEYYKQSANGQRSTDTVYVGEVPNDTMVITGVYNHTGPIFVFNDGVLYVHNATFNNIGDIYVFGNGKFISDSSSLTFPQQYFYQRGLIVVQHGLAYFKDVSFNYSGMQHNLVIGDSGVVGMENVHQADWTTAGLFGKGTIYVHGLNLGGEYILSDSSTSVFSNVDTLLLWHKFPETSVVNHVFPQGNAVYNYEFSNAVSGVSGLGYQVYADSCHTVWWGMMPVNGSDVTISNSNVRVIGAWFQHGDTLTANNIQNGTFYPNNVIPLPDRNLYLLNTYVQTWSFYVFDTSRVNTINCTLGEVGTQHKSQVFSQQTLVDGSGGYFWATDTSVVIASNVNVYSTARSERNGIFILAYSNMPFAGASATGNSLMVNVQSNTAFDPYPYDGAIAWNQKIESPTIAHNDSVISIKGSAWIDQGPLGSWMDFQSYSLYYKKESASVWLPIVRDSLFEIRHNILANWNTFALDTGNYVLRLVVKNDLNDTVESFFNTQLLQNLFTNISTKYADVKCSLSPNPFSQQTTLEFSNTAKENYTLKVYNNQGQLVQELKNIISNKIIIERDNLIDGIYFYKLQSNKNTLTGKFILN